MKKGKKKKIYTVLFSRLQHETNLWFGFLRNTPNRKVRKNKRTKMDPLKCGGKNKNGSFGSANSFPQKQAYLLESHMLKVP